MAAERRVITDLINEMNNLALSAEGPDTLIKWAIITMPNIIDCEVAGIALVRFDTVLLSYSSILGDGKTLLNKFKGKVKEEIEKSSEFESLIWQEADFYGVEDTRESKQRPKKELNSFYIYPMKAKGETLGYMTIGSSQENAFPKFKLNLVENFCDQLVLGLRSLLDRNIVIEQSRLLEEQKRRVEEEKRKIEAIVGGMREGLIITDNDKNIITVNDAASDVIGIKKDNEAKLAMDYIIKKFLEEDKKGAFDKDIILTRPQKKIIHVSTTPIFDLNKELIGRATLLTDVTKEKEVDQMKSDFVSAVSHELRTPLTSIREAIALIYEEITGSINDKQKRCLTVALQDVDRLTRIINNLLNLSRIESGKVKIKRASLVVSQFVEHVITSLSTQAKANGVELKSDIPRDIPSLFADPDQMIQVLTNLVGNALKFTPKGGSITVEASVIASEANQSQKPEIASVASRPRNDKQVCISISDTGPGISVDDQAKLFQKFSQLDTGLTRRSGGTGLGLVISKEIVVRHGGKIWVASESGKGSTFSFTIPVFSVDSAYLDLIQQEIERVKEAKSDLSVIFINPRFKKEMSVGDKKVLVFLEGVCKNSMRRKEDLVLIYKNRYLIIVAEADRDGAERLIVRVRDESRLRFDYHVAVYPRDGIKAEELFEKVEQ